MEYKEPVYDKEAYKRCQKRVEEIKSMFSKRDKLNCEFEKMYWMTDDRLPEMGGPTGLNRSAWDNGDIRTTKSTASRDAVRGLHNMLSTARPEFEVIDCPQKDKIEAALRKWWDASCLIKGNAIHSDMALSAILFGDAILSVDALSDIREYVKPSERARVDEIAEETPFLFEVVPAQTAYPVRGRFGMSEFLREYKERGRTIKERWVVNWLEDDKEYTICDYYDMEYRAVYVKEKSEKPLMYDVHELNNIPVFGSIANGSDLFSDEWKKRQPFLYGKYQGSLDIREDETMTALFTSIAVRGPGPLTFIDKDSLPANGNVEVNMQGAFRYVIGKGQPFDDKAFDSALINALGMLNEIGQRSTINSQTLGENIQSGTTFSGYAMAAQNGRIPLIPIQESLQKAVHDGSVFALRRFKDEAMEWDGLKPSDIPDNFKASQLKVTLEVDLPQDELRNAQIVNQLANLPLSLDSKYKYVKVKDTEKEVMGWMSDNAMMEAMRADMPRLVQELIQMMQPPAPTASPQGQPSPEEMAMMQGQQPSPEQLAAMQSQGQNPIPAGGPEMAQAGAAMMPATEPNVDMQRGTA